MATRTMELPLYACSYCGYEALQLNQIRGQNKSERFICGECMIKAFDTGLQYVPIIEPEVSEPLSEGPKADTGTPETE